ncbi:MAG: hypothetical protein K2Y40_12380 [Reyranella sp.]|nr:hypothetical protein [Reyranella sp.]
MKLYVVHDARGRIRAATMVAGENEAVLCGPLPGRGQKAAEIEVAREHREFGLEKLCTSFRVDTRGDRPRLVEVAKRR